MLMLYMSMLDDERERRVLAEFYEEFHLDCINVAMKMTGNIAMAEDALHEAFISVIKHKEKYLSLSRRDFRRLIVIIVENKIINMFKKDKFIVSTPIDDIEYELESDDIPPDVQVITQEGIEQLNKHLSQIDEASRNILMMKYVQGLSYKEIGNILGITTKHVETKIMRAKAKVRRLYEKEASENERT